MLWKNYELFSPDALWATTFIVKRTTLWIWQVSDSVTISTNTHSDSILGLHPALWGVVVIGPLVRVNICDIVTYDEHPILALKLGVTFHLQIIYFGADQGFRDEVYWDLLGHFLVIFQCFFFLD
jgi:hypothetical protein